MGKNNQPGQRGGRKMSKSEKALNRPESDAHLFRRKKLADDSVKQEAFINKYREKDGLPPIKRSKRSEDKTSVEFHEGDRLGVESGDLIVAQRLYSRDGGGNLVGFRKSEEECMAAHSRVRRERAVYRELDGRMVTAGDVIGIRKGKYMKSRKDDKRRAPGVLRSVMVRLMPNEGELAGQFLDSDGLARAMDQTVREFADALGCDVISAVVHRMSGWDCHIHIQYTMIQPFEETASMLGRRLSPWKEKASAMARAALLAEGKESPAPRTVRAKINALVKSGELEARPVAEIEYRKTVGKRSLLENAILGYSFRHKLNLVRVAEEAGDEALAERVIQMRDGPGNFRAFAKRPDAELLKQYLDLWLERVWRKSVREQLPEMAVEKLLPSGVESATDYVTYGTVLVEDTHLDIRKAELDAQQTAMESAAATARQEAEEVVKAAEEEAEKARLDKEKAERVLNSVTTDNASLFQAAEVERMQRESDLQSARDEALLKLKEAEKKNEDLEKTKMENIDVIAVLINVVQFCFALPGIGKLLEKAGASLAQQILDLDTKKVLEIPKALRERLVLVSKGAAAPSLTDDPPKQK
jgi:hypothetical protein